MNIYKVSQTKNEEYDTFDSFVCITESEHQAKHMYPEEGIIWKNNSWCVKGKNGEWIPSRVGDRWCDPDDVSVEFIGVADKPEPCIILASFNAG